MLTIIIILKPNKVSYSSIKSFCLIILLNTTGKLFEKIIGKWLRFFVISNNFIHLCQLGGLKHRSTTDAGVAFFILTLWSLISHSFSYLLITIFSLLFWTRWNSIKKFQCSLVTIWSIEKPNIYETISLFFYVTLMFLYFWKMFKKS